MRTHHTAPSSLYRITRFDICHQNTLGKPCTVSDTTCTRVNGCGNGCAPHRVASSNHRQQPPSLSCGAKSFSFFLPFIHVVSFSPEPLLFPRNKKRGATKACLEKPIDSWYVDMLGAASIERRFGECRATSDTMYDDFNARAADFLASWPKYFEALLGASRPSCRSGHGSLGMCMYQIPWPARSLARKRRILSVLA